MSNSKIEYSGEQQTSEEAFLIEVKGVKAYVRYGTSDEFVINEVIKGNAYRKLNLKPEDIVFDIGMNIGAFSIWALKKNVKKLYAFEPSPENFRLARRNISINCNTNNISVYEYAVVGDKSLTRSFSLNIKKNKGAHSLLHKNGRNTMTVNCMNFQDLIKENRPTIIKMDIEGGEYECIMNTTDFDNVREFIFEFHHAHLDDIKTRKKYKEVINHLQKYFKHVDYRPETKKAWVTLVYCSQVL